MKRARRTLWPSSKPTCPATSWRTSSFRQHPGKLLPIRYLTGKSVSFNGRIWLNGCGRLTNYLATTTMDPRTANPARIPMTYWRLNGLFTQSTSPSRHPPTVRFRRALYQLISIMNKPKQYEQAAWQLPAFLAMTFGAMIVWPMVGFAASFSLFDRPSEAVLLFGGISGLLLLPVYAIFPLSETVFGIAIIVIWLFIWIGSSFWFTIRPRKRGQVQLLTIWGSLLFSGDAQSSQKSARRNGFSRDQSWRGKAATLL